MKTIMAIINDCASIPDDAGELVIELITLIVRAHTQTHSCVTLFTHLIPAYVIITCSSVCL